MGRETTLRQLIYMCNKEVLKSEGMTRTELHEITNYVLNHAAVSRFTPDEVYITEGSILGVGEENKDKTIRLPRFLVYSWGKINAFGFINNRESRNFSLQSCDSFERLEAFLRFNTGDDIVAVIDGEIVDFEIVRRNNWCIEVIWDKDAFIVTYVLGGKEEKEVLRSKKQLEERVLELEERVLELVEKGATEIVAYDIVEGESLDFEISKTVYTTRPERLSDNGDLGLMWLRENEGFFEEEAEDEELMF